ncbi:hypothetical protein M413DRAFT_352910 [Hebeloma cylindrosporum]|uniref:Uncharacterized protein n=1 Tax=Hebeloma cylindrosporum TaxID=76867 RepID=A0A0C2YTR6_HEBCY|nr:hypothetical protein M413DRAFT_352910 [Hebeloma cylindrosporum h7]
MDKEEPNPRSCAVFCNSEVTQSITSLNGLPLWKVFWDIIKCEYLLRLRHTNFHWCDITSRPGVSYREKMRCCRSSLNVFRISTSDLPLLGALTVFQRCWKGFHARIEAKNAEEEVLCAVLAAFEDPKMGLEPDILIPQRGCSRTM